MISSSSEKLKPEEDESSESQRLTLEALMIAPDVEVSAVTFAAVLTVLKAAFFVMSVVATLLALLTRSKAPSS